MLSVSFLKKLPDFKIDVHLEIENQIAILFGASGSGKTTILNGIAGLIQPDAAEIILNNRILYKNKRYSVPVQKRNIGYLFQDYALFPHMTVWKNITYQMKDEALVKQLIKVIGIEHLLEKYPNRISGGEKQRVALIRALATKPDLLLLDEPFSALDDQTKLQCHEELLRLHEIWKIPVIMVTHNKQEALKLGDKLYTINKGKIVEEKIVKKG